MPLYGDKISPEEGFRELKSSCKVYGKKWRDFIGPELVVRFEKHLKAVSGSSQDRLRGREVFGSFEKRTPGN